MSDWSLSKILESLHEDIQQKLKNVRESFVHPDTKGDASEIVWLKLLQTYLPRRYQVKKAHIVDSMGDFSEQIDVVIFDRQYSPFIFHYEDQIILPAESIYAVFEAKQTVNAKNIRYAQKKVQSVRKLHRTSLPIPYANGTYDPKPPISILGGILAFESDWNPPLGQPFMESLELGKDKRRLDLGCIATHGYFNYNKETSIYDISKGSKPATAFLFNLISQLQFSGTVPMIDVQAYAKWLKE